jgi:cadmium resistance protein CadD (predicted permease)
MNTIVNVLVASVTTFAATNIDDIFLLTVLFARRVPTRRIVAGQYLGFAAIIIVSLTLLKGVAFAIPQEWIRILGILPLAIGVKEFVHIHRFEAGYTERTGSLSLLSIAAITVANGADNVGVYVPFFVASRSHLRLVLVVYGLLVFAWCAVGNWFGRHALVLKSLDRWGHWMVPLVLIGLGTYVLLFV